MIGAVILCMGLIGPGGGGAGFAAAAAAVPPSSGTPTAPPASHRRDDDGDIPFFAPGFFRFDRRSRMKRGDRSSGRTRGRRGGGRRGDDGDDVSDVAASADGRDRDASENDDDGDDDRGPPLFFMGQYDDSDYDSDDGRRRDRYERDRRRRTKGRRGGRGRGRRNDDGRRPLDPVRRWALEKTGMRIPRIHVHFDPVTILKLRKSWHGVVPGAVVRVGADFETHRGRSGGGGAWRLRGCVEDKLIGGRLTIREGRRGGRGRRDDDGGIGRAVLVEYSKSWLFPGAGERRGIVRRSTLATSILPVVWIFRRTDVASRCRSQTRPPQDPSAPGSTCAPRTTCRPAGGVRASDSDRRTPPPRSGAAG